jgi:hypothetical protein
MNLEYQAWLAQAGSLGGVLACGFRFPEGQSLNQSATPAFAPAQLDEAWNQVTETIKALNLRRISVDRLLWKFEHYHLLYWLRPDGLALGLLVDSNASPDLAPLECSFRDLPYLGQSRAA